ncbi:UPF0158 family protein [Elusimicrobiota bacterium]
MEQKTDNMNPPAKLSDLIQTFEIETDTGEYHCYFDRKTGQVVLVDDTVYRHVEESDDEALEDVPEWQKEQIEIARAVLSDNEKRFISPPDKFDFHEYRHMERFIASLPDRSAADALFYAIKGRGAFRRFKDMLDQMGILDQWFKYREEAMKRYVIEWAEDKNVPYEDDTGSSK